MIISYQLKNFLFEKLFAASLSNVMIFINNNPPFADGCQSRRIFRNHLDFSHDSYAPSHPIRRRNGHHTHRRRHHQLSMDKRRQRQRLENRLHRTKKTEQLTQISPPSPLPHENDGNIDEIFSPNSPCTTRPFDDAMRHTNRRANARTHSSRAN